MDFCRGDTERSGGRIFQKIMWMMLINGTPNNKNAKSYSLWTDCYLLHYYVYENVYVINVFNVFMALRQNVEHKLHIGFN